MFGGGSWSSLPSSVIPREVAESIGMFGGGGWSSLPSSVIPREVAESIGTPALLLDSTTDTQNDASSQHF